MRQIGIQIRNVIIVVQSIFFFKLGFVGADDGVPSATDPKSFWVFMFKGSKTNKVKNQITENNTKAAEIVIWSPLNLF